MAPPRSRRVLLSDGVSTKPNGLAVVPVSNGASVTGTASVGTDDPVKWNVTVAPSVVPTGTPGHGVTPTVTSAGPTPAAGASVTHGWSVVTVHETVPGPSNVRCKAWADVRDEKGSP